MRDVLVLARAQRDLIQIWHYTYRNWGEAHADRYLDNLELGINGLASESERGYSRETLCAGYWPINVGRHVVFYTFADTTTEVQRILHYQISTSENEERTPSWHPRPNRSPFQRQG